MQCPPEWEAEGVEGGRVSEHGERAQAFSAGLLSFAEQRVV
jgi:hypothetical protein